LAKNLVASLGGGNLVIGVDRLDYSKGLVSVSMLSTFSLRIAANGSAR
jgi:trehalose-6-phosphate synthase